MPRRKPQKTEDMKPLFPFDTVGGIEESWARSYCMELNHDSFTDGPCPVCSRTNKQDFAKVYHMILHENAGQGKDEDIGVCRLWSGFFQNE